MRCSTPTARSSTTSRSPSTRTRPRGGRALVDQTGAIRRELTLPRSTPEEDLDEPATSLLAGTDEEYVTAAPAVAEDLEAIAPKVGPQYTLEQDVKPGLDARFTQRSYETRKKCLNEPLWVDLEFRGEGPWHLDYEVIHNGQRRKQQETDIISRYHLLDVGPATTGGTYVIALTAVTDSTGCRIPLGGEAQIQVSQSQPKAAFGKIDGAYKVAALEGSKIKLPLRMQGVAPWFVAYVNDQKAGSAPRSYPTRS